MYRFRITISINISSKHLTGFNQYCPSQLWTSVIRVIEKSIYNPWLFTQWVEIKVVIFWHEMEEAQWPKLNMYFTIMTGRPLSITRRFEMLSSIDKEDFFWINGLDGRTIFRGIFVIVNSLSCFVVIQRFSCKNMFVILHRKYLLT